jgi:(S)-2-hydroxyglutarate dehydrogenase
LVSYLTDRLANNLRFNYLLILGLKAKVFMYDLAVIGGGIVGLSTAMAVSKRFPQARIVVLEKESSWAYHQTGNNSGVIHSGIYYKPGSFKAKFCRDGSRSMVEFCQTHNIPYEVCGKVIVATENEQLPRLENLYNRGLENQLKVTKLTCEQVKEVEPHVSCIAGLKVFTTGIADYKKVCQKYAELVQAMGGELRLNTKVEKIRASSNDVQVLETNQGAFETRFIINCAGLHSDRLAKLADVEPQAKIVPFRGEYYELTPEKRYLVNTLIYPVPSLVILISFVVHASPAKLFNTMSKRIRGDAPKAVAFRINVGEKSSSAIDCKSFSTSVLHSA